MNGISSSQHTDEMAIDERGTFQVAVTVFATTKGYDRRDAAMTLRMAVHAALAEAGSRVRPGLLRLEFDGDENRAVPDGVHVVAEVYGIVDAALALANGYLWCEPTGKAFNAPPTAYGEQGL